MSAGVGGVRDYFREPARAFFGFNDEINHAKEAQVQAERQRDAAQAREQAARQDAAKAKDEAKVANDGQAQAQREKALAEAQAHSAICRANLEIAQANLERLNQFKICASSHVATLEKCMIAVENGATNSVENLNSAYDQAVRFHLLSNGLFDNNLNETLDAASEILLRNAEAKKEKAEADVKKANEKVRDLKITECRKKYNVAIDAEVSERREIQGLCLLMFGTPLLFGGSDDLNRLNSRIANLQKTLGYFNDLVKRSWTPEDAFKTANRLYTVELK